MIMAYAMILIALMLEWAYGEYELKFAAVFLRHGARSPLRQPAPDRKEIWNDGYGELTPSGQREHYLLGRVLRKYFIDEQHLISPVFNQSQVYIRSTFVHRTVMSVQSMALGLFFDGQYKLTESQLKKENIWTPPTPLTISNTIKEELKESALPFDIPPLPIRTFKNEYDRMLLFSSCPRYTHLRDNYYQTEKFDKYYKENNATFQKVCSMMRIDCSNVKGKQLFFYVDYFIASEFDGQFPELSENKELLKSIQRIYTHLLADELSNHKDMKGMAFHNFSSIVPKFFDNTLNNPDNAYKLALFATHDSTILAYLFAFGVTDKKFFDIIPYASHIIVELKKKVGAKNDDRKAYIVNVTYNGEPIFAPKTLNQFVEDIKKAGNMDDRTYEEVCTLESAQLPLSSSSASLWFITLTGCAMLLACGALFWAFRNKKVEAVFLSEPSLQSVN